MIGSRPQDFSADHHSSHFLESPAYDGATYSLPGWFYIAYINENLGIQPHLSTPFDLGLARKY